MKSEKFENKEMKKAEGIAQYVDAIKLLEEAKRIEKESTCS